jgi:hypothetical protein
MNKHTPIPMPTFHSTLAPWIERFIAGKQACGYKYFAESESLHRLCLASIRFPGRRSLFFPDVSAGCYSFAVGAGRPFLACSTR